MKSYDKLDVPTHNVGTRQGYINAANTLRRKEAVLITGSEKSRARFHREVVQKVTKGYSEYGGGSYVDMMAK